MSTAVSLLYVKVLSRLPVSACPTVLGDSVEMMAALSAFVRLASTAMVSTVDAQRPAPMRTQVFASAGRTVVRGIAVHARILLFATKAGPVRHSAGLVRFYCASSHYRIGKADRTIFDSGSAE